MWIMKRRGFTLVELLVVVGIIALLLTLAVEGLRIVREQARAAVCAANVRQLVTGLIAYETANEQFPPGFAIPNPRPGVIQRNAGAAGFMDPGGWWWFDYIQKFNHLTMDGYKTLICPSKRLENRFLELNVLCGNYGANLSVFRPVRYIDPYHESFSGVSLSAQQIPRPSQTLLVADSGYSLISWLHVTDEPPIEMPAFNSTSEILSFGAAQHAAYVPGMSINQEKMVCQGQSLDAIDGRHPHKTVNVGLADGSVAIKRPADELLVQKTGADEWDKTPVWQPRRDPSVAVSSAEQAP